MRQGYLAIGGGLFRSGHPRGLLAVGVQKVQNRVAIASASYRIEKPQTPENRKRNRQKIGKIGEKLEKNGQKIGNSYFFACFSPIFPEFGVFLFCSWPTRSQKQSRKRVKIDYRCRDAGWPIANNQAETLQKSICSDQAKTRGGTNRVFGEPCFCPLPKRGRFDENGESDEFAFYPLKTRVWLLRPPKTTKMTKMAGVTQEKAWFRKNLVCSSLKNFL